MISTRKGQIVYVNAAGYPLDRSFSRQGIILGETEEHFIVDLPFFRGEGSVPHIVPKNFCQTLDSAPTNWHDF